MVISRRDLISVIVFPAFIGVSIYTFRGVAMFPFFESLGAPLSSIVLVSLAVAPALIFDGFLLDRVRRRKPFFLLFFPWAAIAFLPIIFKTAVIAPIYVVATSILMGLTYPPAFSFLADHTKVYERGRVAGMELAVIGLLGVILLFAVSWSLDLWFALVGVFAVTMGLVGVFFAEEKISPKEAWKRIPTRSIFGDKNLLLYYAAGAILGFFWASNAFLVGNYAAGLLQNPRFTFWLVNLSVTAISGFFIGVLVDRLGRRPTIVTGALLFASSFMGFVLYREIWTFLLTATFFGIAYGCMWIPLLVTVFGDLAQKEIRGRYYGIGIACMSLGIILGGMTGILLLNSSAAVVMTFTVFVAFLIILPTMIAKETLPPKKRIEEMLEYIKEIEEETSEDEDNTPSET